ncbi:MAG: hypothetical protein ABEL51_00380 [Salinibacter sp.]
MSRRRGSPHSDQGPVAGRSPRRGRGDGAPNTSKASGTAADGWQRHGTALPGWADLETTGNRRRAEADGTFLERVSTVRFALVILALAGAFTLWVGHVHATTDLYSRLQQARRENQQLHLKHDRLEGAYDRRTGPSVIYERARELGLRESVTYGRPINIE